MGQSLDRTITTFKTSNGNTMLSKYRFVMTDTDVNSNMAANVDMPLIQNRYNNIVLVCRKCRRDCVMVIIDENVTKSMSMNPPRLVDPFMNFITNQDVAIYAYKDGNLVG
jgi:hypothetical protein